jgi:uncharacterized protein YdaU (DUF1376 family)
MKLSGVISFPFHIGDFLGGTIHMDTIEKGAYIMLLLAHYQIGEDGLPDDDKQLARICGVTGKKWSLIRPILEQKFDVENGRWKNKRVIVVLQKVEDNSSSQRAKALKRHSAGDAAAMPQQCQPETRNQKPNKYGFSDEILQAWKSAYPLVNVDAEIAKAYAWEMSNPKNEKKNKQRFVNSWLSRAKPSPAKPKDTSDKMELQKQLMGISDV